MTEKERMLLDFKQYRYTRDDFIPYLVGYLSKSHLQMSKSELLDKISRVKLILECAMELPASIDAYLSRKEVG